jgi:hypothetical protein
MKMSIAGNQFKISAIVCFVLAVVILGSFVIAQTTLRFISFEAENGSAQSNVAVVNDTSASAGASLQIGQAPSWNPNITLPPGSALPSDATCASRVSHKTEIRPQNAVQNATAGQQKNIQESQLNRVTGNYTGTTDDILQWTACKWGIDVDIVRAQAAKESYWTQSAKGDWTTNASACPPGHGIGVDGTPGQCPESYGILQMRYLYHGQPSGRNTWPEAETSTAYNADYTYGIWRQCFEGELWWLNTVERGAEYVAGDAMGCTGVWFSGRWKTAAANTYIQAVQDYKNQRIWETQSFINYR